MSIAYGWPQVIPLEPGLCPTSQRIVFLRVSNGLLLVVSPFHLELWSSSQHRVRLGKFLRDPDSVQKEGENVEAIWSPDNSRVAVMWLEVYKTESMMEEALSKMGNEKFFGIRMSLCCAILCLPIGSRKWLFDTAFGMTSLFFLYIFSIQFTGKQLILGGKQSAGLFLATISIAAVEKAPYSEKRLTISNFVCDNDNILLGLSTGAMSLISWKGEFLHMFELHSHPLVNTELHLSLDNGFSLSEDSTQHRLKSNYAIHQLELSIPLRLLVVLYYDGPVALCSISKKGLKLTNSIQTERWLGSSDAVCASIASDQQILAIGCRRGVVELYDLSKSGSLLRNVSLYDWGYSVEDTGSVSCISWAPDNASFAVGWKCRGLTVWSTSGCRLMSTIRQIGISSATSPIVKSNQDCKYEPMMGGASSVQWDDYGYRIYAIEQRTSDRVIAFSFGKCCLNRGIAGTTYARQVIYGEDRVLLVQPEDTDELKILHLNIPVSYISQNWPILHVAVSKDGMYLAVAGLRGLILYDMKYKKWRLFGDITQEQKIQCKGLLWLGKIVVVCNYNDSSSLYELLFYPRYHLDQSSMLCRKTLPGKPIAMDVCQDYILITYHPFDVHIFHAKVIGELSPSGNPVLELHKVRELSIMTAKKHLAAMRIIPDPSPRESTATKKNSMPASFMYRQPTRCLILRASGELSLLDMDDGSEHDLTDSVELFWVTCGQTEDEDKSNLIEEVSWLDYGHRGMQVWYPSPGVDPFEQEDFLQLDPELEFDREVYPLGLLPNAGVVVGVTQRMSFSACTEFPCFEPTPQAQTILHCLLRHLLQRDKSEEALSLAHLSAEKPHFSHCLEWLLFTVFDAEISRQNVSKNQSPVPKKTNPSLLEQTCSLIRNFPEYLDVVVSVARKTDGRHWADLFSAAGRSTELFEECFQRQWYRTAACYILVIAKLEGSSVSQYNALRLLQATLDESLYELAGSWFLLRSGRDYEHVASESERLSPRFLGSFIFRASYWRQTSDLKSSLSKEQGAHINSVKNILESHAGYLMSGRELSKLVAFVKGTQFDLVEYLQRERCGSARLESFAAGIELIGQKLQMGTLQSRLDAEFLLAHMCTVGFKEWIVVLATLLRRTEVLIDLFQDDMRLWKAYSTTLQSHPAFVEYNDLLEIIEDQLSLQDSEK